MLDEFDTTYSTRIYEKKFSKGVDFVYFDYEVNGDTIRERLHKHYFPEDFEFNGDKYKVYYNRKYPEVAYLQVE